MDLWDDDGTKLLKLVDQENWDEIDLERFVERLDQTGWSNERKQEVYAKFYLELRYRERFLICHWVEGDMFRWWWVFPVFPLIVTACALLLGWLFTPWFYLAGIALIIIATVDGVICKVRGRKAKVRMDYFKNIGFDMYGKDVPVHWGSEEVEKRGA